MAERADESAAPPLRVAFAPGVTPGKWARTWGQRTGVPLELLPVDEAEQVQVLRDGRADMSFVRLPVDRDGLDLIPLYREVPVVVVPRDHVVTAFDEVSVADLADEHLLQDPDLVPEWRDVATEVRDGTRYDVPAMTMRQAMETVAAGTGILVVPMSIARLHHRKDLAYRPVRGVAETQVGLAWLREALDERLERFIGIVRGRTERSSRGGPELPAPDDQRGSGEQRGPKAGAGGTRQAAGSGTRRGAGSRAGSQRRGRPGSGGRRGGRDGGRGGGRPGRQSR